MSKPVVSVVTLTWNSERFIASMLQTLLADSRGTGVDVEVIVIDNGSTDGTLKKIEAMRADCPEVQLVPLSQNLGTTITRNIGMRMSRGDYVFILDSDTQILPGTLQGLIDSFDVIGDRKTTGIVCPQLMYPNGDFQESARRFPTLLTKAYRMFQLEELRERDESLPEVLAKRVTTADYGISAAWFLPRATLDRVGLLDERIFYAPEDVEYCARVWKAGLKVWYYPPVSIIHDCQRVTNKKPFTALGARHARDLCRYWLETRSFLSRPAIGCSPSVR
jgi:GT2 family glycosyltransferase